MNEEELKIDIKTDTDVSEVKKKLNTVIEEYDKKGLEFQVKLGKFDISGISSSIARLTSDLNALSNIEFSGLNKLETNLKNINKLMAKQGTKFEADEFDLGGSSNVSKLVQDQKGALEQIKELDDVGKALKEAMSKYTKSLEKSFKDFNKENEDIFSDINFLKNSSSKSAFKKMIQYKEEMESLSKELGNLGVALTPKEKTFEMDSGRTGVKKWTEYEDLIGQSEERFKSAVERAKEIGKRTNQLKKNLSNNLEKISDDERHALESIDLLKKDLISVDTSESDSIANYMKSMLKDFMSLEDISHLDLRFDSDMIKGYQKFLNSIDEMKKEFNETFKNDSDFVKFDIFDNVNKIVENLDNSVKSVNLDNLKEKLTNAFDIDEKVIANIEKIEGALKQLNSMSDLVQKSLFEEKGNKKSNIEIELDNKIKEYLSVDKSINDAYSKMAKEQLKGNSEVVNALEVEIGLLRQKQGLYAMDMRSLGVDDRLLSQVKLQEELNRAIRETSEIEFKGSFIDKLHKEALGLNKEFDEIANKQREISNFDSSKMVDFGNISTDNIKSFVQYLDSSEDGIKQILTQYTKLKGIDLTTTLYGDGTEVRKITGNIDKAINELASSYKQADNELTRLIKTQSQMEFKGDTESVRILEEQINKWKTIKSEVEDTARLIDSKVKSSDAFNKMIEKSSSTLLKNKQLLESNDSKVEFQMDVNNEQAIRKFDEFKTKAFSNLQELERKYKGTQLFDEASRQAEEFRNNIRELENSLDTTSKIDMSKLSSEFRNINQSITQTKRDMNDLNKSMTNNFFDDLYDSMRTFTLGDMIGDAIQGSVSQIQDAVVGLDNAMRDMMKVAPSSFEGSSDQLKMIKNDALEVAKSVGQSTEDVIQGMAKALQTGIGSMQDALEVAKGSSMFANVGDLDQGTADTYIASIMSAFGGMENSLKPVRNQINGMSDDYNNLTNFIDMANYAGNNFSISTGDVGEALQRSGAILSNYGVTLDESVALIVGANESVQDASIVGTSLKSMSINLGGMKANAKEGNLELNKTAKALKELAGVDVYSDKQKGEVKDMMQILKEVNEVYDDLSQDQQLALGEAIAGKHHANTFQALMGNWETVIEYQEAYNNGWTVGSAEKENERFLDSIEGKWNKLRENLKAIATTTISSDFAKDFLDGAISFTDGLNEFIKNLDELNMVVPVTIGILTSLGQSFKALSGNGSINVFGSGFINAIKGANKEIENSKVKFSATGNSINRLSSGQVKLSKSTTKTSQSFKNFAKESTLANGGVVRLDRANTSLTKSQTKATKGVSTYAKTLGSTVTGSKLAMVGTSLLNGALVSLAVAGIGMVVKAMDEHNRRYEIAADKNRENISNIQDELQAYNGQKKSLEGIASEYDILASKSNKTTEELARFKELQSEIADLMPELVVGYDSEGSPILAMNGDVTDLIKEIDRAIESKNKLLNSEKNGLRMNALETSKKDIKELEKSYKQMDTLVNNKGNRVDFSLKEGWRGRDISKQVNENIKALEKYEIEYTKAYSEQLKALEGYKKTELEIQEANLNDLWNTDGFKGLADDLASSMNVFASTFDWMDIDLSGQKELVKGMEELSKAANEGNFDVQDFNKRWQEVNDVFKTTDDIDSYNKSISSLAKELEDITGVDASKWIEGLTQQSEGLTYADRSLQNFMQSYNKNLNDLKNGDSVAVHLSKQFNELQNYIQNINGELINAGKIDIEFLADIKNSDNFKLLPQQIQTLINSIMEDGKVTEVEEDVLVKVNSMIENEGKLPDDVAEQLNRMFSGTSTEKELQFGISFGDINIPPNVVALMNEENKKNELIYDFVFNDDGIEKVENLKDSSVVKEVDVKVNNKEELDKLDNALNETRKTSESKILVDIVGKEQADLYLEIINNLDANPELTNKLILENQGALSELKSYEEVVQWLQQNPDIVSNYKVNGIESIDEATEKSKTLNENMDETNQKDVNLTVNKGELEGSIEDFNDLIELSSQVKNGEYEISFKANLGNSIQQINDLSLAVNGLYNQLRGLPEKSVNIETGVAARKLSGLITRINETKQGLESIPYKQINVETGVPARKLSGLIKRAEEYKTAINNVKYTSIDVDTSKANAKLVATKTLIDNIKSKTVTITVNKVNTGGGDGDGTFSHQSIQAETLKVQQQLRDSVSSEPVDVSTSFTNTTPIITPFVRKISPVQAKGYFDFNVDAFKKLENALKDISNQLDILEEKSEKAFGSKKIAYLKEQVSLLEKQKKVQHQLAEDMRVQQKELKKLLSDKGFTFNADGNIDNYSEKLLKYEQHVESLRKKSEANSKNDKLKSQYEASKDDLDKIKNALNSYLDITFDKLPNASKEWLSLQNEINNAKAEIDKVNLSMKTLDLKINVGNSEASLNSIRREINRLDEDIERAYGSDKIALINKKNELLKKEQQELHKLANNYREQANVQKDYLSSKGFKFNDDGTISNLEHLKSLTEDITYDNIKESLEEYIDLTQKDIPNLSEDWWDLQDAIEASKDEIEEIIRTQKLLTSNNKLIELNDQYEDIANALDMIDAKAENFYGKDKLDILNEKVDLLEQQKKKLHEIANTYREQLKLYQSDLSNFGFEFDVDGNIKDIDGVLNSLSNSKDFETAKDLVEEYLDIQNNKIPQASKEWWELENAIKGVLKEQLEITKKVQDQITDMYKKEVEERKKLIDEELNKRLDALDKEKQAYLDAKKEKEYKDNYDDQLKKVMDIEKQLAILSKDTSLSGQKKYQELLDQLKDEQKKLEDLVQNKIDEDVLDSFDKESDRLEEEADKEKEDLDEKYSDKNLQEIVDKVLSTGVFETLDGQLISLSDAMANYIDEYGEGMSAVGSIIKNEWLSNLEIAKETMKDMASILGELNLSELKSKTMSFTMPQSNFSVPSTSSTSNSNISFNQPFIVIEGNVDKDVMFDLERFGNKLKNDVINTIAKSIR